MRCWTDDAGGHGFGFPLKYASMLYMPAAHWLRSSSPLFRRPHHLHRDPQAHVTVRIGRAHLDERHVDPDPAAADELGELGQEHRNEVRPAVLHRLAYVGTDEERGVAEAIGVLARIFEPFCTTKEQGTGLGLAIVHRIVTDHKGRVTVARRAERTVFTIELRAMTRSPCAPDGKDAVFAQRYTVRAYTAGMFIEVLGS